MKSGAKLSAAEFLHEKWAYTAFLCATSVCSVPLWFMIAQKKQPQRHRAHRGCTEKKPNRDFSCEASLTLHLCTFARNSVQPPNSLRRTYSSSFTPGRS